MKGDFSRRTFEGEKHYNSLLIQQGRVQLDADWNEQSDILKYLDRTTHRDVIGHGGVPLETPNGFNITVSGATLSVGRGRIYVDGILCENELECSFSLQPDFQPLLPTNPATYMAYLDVWERHITALEDEDIKEPALGGPDTATRVKTVWQVKLAEIGNLGSDIGCDIQDADWRPERSSGQMAARAEPEADSGSLCLMPETAGYRGLENQLYRVEIHAPGDRAGATAKWSQDNGSVTARIEGIADKTISIKDHPKDHVLGFAPGHWVEITNEETVRNGTPGALAKLGSVNQEALTVIGWQGGVAPVLGTNPIVRRWDGVLEGLATPGGWLHLKEGVQVSFASGLYNTGDYWQIPARSAMGDVLWPKTADTPSFKAPMGVHHHYCPLAVLDRDPSGWRVINDCRSTFPPLSAVPETQPAEVRQVCCCAVTVGEGGDYSTLEEALVALPEKAGGRIHLLAGVHQARIMIHKRDNIQITGCDDQTIVFNDPDGADAPIIAIDDAHNIQIDHLTLVAIDGTAIRIQDAEPAKSFSQDIRIVNNHIAASVRAIEIQGKGNGEGIIAGNQSIIIGQNRILGFNQNQGKAAILVSGNDISIVANHIRVHAEKSEAVVKSLESLRSQSPVPAAELSVYVNGIFLNTDGMDSAYSPTEFEAQGGVQIGGGSQRVEIVGNEITGGYGSGITFGVLPDLAELRRKFVISPKNGISDEALKRILENANEDLQHITIKENAIASFGMSGIGVVAVFDDELERMISVQDLTVDRNTIGNCALSIPVDFEKEIPETVQGVAFGGIALTAAENVIITQNRIADNGSAGRDPICGIYLYHGEKIEISNNRILNNGSSPSSAGSDLMPPKGIRGGIVVELGEAAYDYTVHYTHGYSDSEEMSGPPNGVPAVKVQNNIVVQPWGQALSIVTLGSTLISGNNFTSQGLDHGIGYLDIQLLSDKLKSPGKSARSFLGGAVYIVNLGKSKEANTFFNRASMVFRHGAPMDSYGRAAPPPDNGIDMDAEFTLPNPEDLSTFSIAQPTLAEGHVLYANNQAHLDLKSEENQWVGASQFIFTLDDVSYQGNQSAVSNWGNLVIANTVAWALTGRINGNRFQEDPAHAMWPSLCAMAWANCVTSNQASHCMLVFGNHQLSVNSANRELSDCEYMKMLLQTAFNSALVPSDQL